MKNKAILVSFIALFAIALTLGALVSVRADDSDSDTDDEDDFDFVEITKVVVNDVRLNEERTYVGQVSDTVPIRVEFRSNKDISERIKIKVYIEGYKDDISEEVILRTPLEEDVEGYVARIALTLPSTMDIDDLSEDLELRVRISAKGEESVEVPYTIRMERDLFSLNILSVESPDKIVSGGNVALDVVVENNGHERLDNVYLKASIPELGVSRNIYVGDIGSNEESDDFYFENIRNAVEKRIYLPIPRNSNPGTYNVVVEVYNYDTSVITKKKITIESLDSGVIPSISGKTIAIGQEGSFDLVLVNPNDRMVVYTITPEESTGLVVTIDQPVVSVPADSSKTVKVNVRATNSAQEGTHLVTVNVNSDTGTAKQTSFSVNVQRAGGVTGPAVGGTSNTVLILTIVLAIIFVVLLVVLIVLLTKKPAESEEFGETSYY